MRRRAPLARRALVTAMLVGALAVVVPEARPVSLSLQQSVAVLDGTRSTADVLASLPVGVASVPYIHLPMIAVQGTSTQLNLVRRLAGVKAVWADRPLPYALRESVPLIGADRAWRDLGVDGTGVGVAVIDSGIDGTHQDVAFPGHTIRNVKFLGATQVFADARFTLQDDLEDTDTNSGHGTHVAGVIAGTGAASDGYLKGVAPGANLIGLSAGEAAYLLTTLAAYDWVLENHDFYNIKVINNSWADGSIAYDPNDPLNIASKKAYDAGIAVVFAAGNDGPSNTKFNRYAFPDWVISVGGGDKLGALASYSSRGDSLHHPTLTAPGSYIASAFARTGVATAVNGSLVDLTDPEHPRPLDAAYVGKYIYALGTSMAAPHVAGTAALMLQANPDLTPDRVKTILAETATSMSPCPVTDCGAGYLNAFAAVQGALATSNQPPVALVRAPATAKKGKAANFDASASSDPDGHIATYVFDFGDGAPSTQSSAVAKHVYSTKATYPWSVTVIDDAGAASDPPATGLITIR